MDEAVEEGAVGEDVVVSFAFQSAEEPSEAEQIEEEEFLAEKKREKRGFGDGFLLTGLEVLGVFESSGDPIGEREFDCVKIGDFKTFTDEVFPQKFELSRLAASIHAGKGDVFHRLRVSKSAILGNERRFFGYETGYQEVKMIFFLAVCSEAEGIGKSRLFISRLLVKSCLCSAVSFSSVSRKIVYIA